MLRKNDCIKEFKNHNLHIKYDADTIDLAKKDEILVLSDILCNVNCEFIGESFCLSNYDMGHIIYNVYSDVWYIISWSDADKLLDGKTLILYARKPDADIRELIAREYED